LPGFNVAYQSRPGSFNTGLSAKQIGQKPSLCLIRPQLLFGDKLAAPAPYRPFGGSSHLTATDTEPRILSATTLQFAAQPAVQRREPADTPSRFSGFLEQPAPSYASGGGKWVFKTACGYISGLFKRLPEERIEIRPLLKLLLRQVFGVKKRFGYCLSFRHGLLLKSVR
jgi:hypothetical protein